jgi:hypothetical protein
MWYAGRTDVTCNGLYIAQIGVIMELPSRTYGFKPGVPRERRHRDRRRN